MYYVDLGEIFPTNIWLQNGIHYSRERAFQSLAALRLQIPQVAGRSFPGFVAHCLESSTAGASSTVEDPGVFRNQREAASAL